ncbi:hypothetical protein CDD83_4885 [Cordyceps sp. RAO-2017]|nr:hypothetical protein CDD83_4885 [Cordyceps sp. RAO-2017]
MSRTRGVFLNPRVRVGYSLAAYRATHRPGAWVSAWDIFRGLWLNRLRRWASVAPDGWAVRRRLRRWERDQPAREPGSFCLVDELQVLVDNGWAHV